MLVTIHQPDFLPWLGFFERWACSDLWIVLDDVQFLRRGWHHRDRIKTAQGVQWLTLPVQKKGRYHQLIDEVLLDPEPSWRERHLKTIQLAYAKAPCFARVFAGLEALYGGGHERLIELNLELVRWMAGCYGIETPMVLASAYAVRSTRSERLLELVRAVGGDGYLCGSGSRAYLDEGLFAEAGIEVHWQDFQHPVYPQLHGDFEAGLSALDHLMMVEDAGRIFSERFD